MCFYLFISCDLSSSARGRDLNRNWLDSKVSPPLIRYVWIEFVYCELVMRSQTYDGPEPLFVLSKVEPLCEALNTELHKKKKGHYSNNCIQH